VAAVTDFGTFYLGAPIGIPYAFVTGAQPKVSISYFPEPDGWAGESDPGPMPIPPDVPVEGGPNADGDRHVLVVDSSSCTLYESNLTRFMRPLHSPRS
jgi:hypothetical protein